MSSIQLPRLTTRHRALGAALLTLLLIGGFVLQYSDAIPSLYWMRIYEPRAVASGSWAEIAAFFRDLRTGIPPFIAFMEIMSLRLIGSTALVTMWLYRIGLLGVYAIAIYMNRQSVGRVVLTGSIAVIYVCATALIHPGNREIYDVLYPLFMILFALSLGRAVDPARTPRSALAWSALSGFMLTMAELSRPFVLYFLPILLPIVIAALLRTPSKGRMIACFLLPLLIFSGGWHLKLIVFNEGQIGWSNHSGCNLHNAWREAERIDALPTAPPLGADLDPNLNTGATYQNCQHAQAAVLRWMAAHPIRTVIKTGAQVLDLYKPHTELYGSAIPAPMIPVYSVAVWFPALMLLINAIYLLVTFIRRRDLAYLAQPRHLLIVIAVMTSLVMAVGDDGEESRFIMSVLPILAAIPFLLPELTQALRQRLLLAGCIRSLGQLY